MDDTRWEELNPSEPGLVEARLLLQQAVQLVAAVGQSLGERAADDFRISPFERMALRQLSEALSLAFLGSSIHCSKHV